MTFDELVEPKIAKCSESMQYVMKEIFREVWNAAVEECAMTAWRRGVDGADPGDTINRRVITGLIVDDIRAVSGRE